MHLRNANHARAFRIARASATMYSQFQSGADTSADCGAGAQAAEALVARSLIDMGDWWPDLSESDKPRYLAIADAISEGIRNGRLAPSDRLPPQRKLARRLDIDFTTVARGYVEAQKRGLIESKVGQGTFVREKPRPRRTQPMPAPRPVDLSMNLPPEPNDPDLIERMQAGVEYVSRDIVALLRYQGFGGVQADKDAA